MLEVVGIVKHIIIMDLEINKFCNNNNLKIKSFKKKILIADRALPEAVIVNSLAAYSLNKNFKFNAEVITDVSKENDLLKDRHFSPNILFDNPKKKISHLVH